MNTKLTEHRGLAWSLIDAKPVVEYFEEIDAELVFWNGYVLTKNIALNLIVEPFGVYATPQMNASMISEYELLYRTGFFDEPWDDFFYSRYPQVITYLRKILGQHIIKLTKDKKITEILKWFE